MTVPADAVARCPHAARCPGCDHVGVPYGAQLAAKARAVGDAFAPYAELRGTEVKPTRGASAIERYRTRSKWVAGRGGALGLFERGGHAVVDVPECAVATDVTASATAAVRVLVRSRVCPGVSASLRAVDVREILGEDGATRCLLTLVLVREHRPPKRELAEAATRLRNADPRIAGVSVNWAPAKAVQILGDETELLAGDGEPLDRQGDVLVTARPGAFVQAHRDQAATLARAIVAGAASLATGERASVRVLELFAGAAPFGLALARAGHDVTSVESFAPAAAGVARAAAAQGLTIRSHAWDATSAVVRHVHDAERFDLVLVDPPRRGLAPALRDAIADLAPRAVAYVSCDPATLARDLAHLAHRGYAAPSVEPWDFIPLSAHVEAFVWLAPATPPPLRVLARRGPCAIVEVPAHVDPKRLATRVGRELGIEPRAWPTWSGASGALVVGVSAAPTTGSARVVAALRGRPRRELRGPWTSLEVLRSSEGRSRVVIVAALSDLPRVGRALARAGHPVLGDPADAPTARHLAEKHGVDRPLVHVEGVHLEADGASTDQRPPPAPIPGDLAVALDRLDLG